MQKKNLCSQLYTNFEKKIPKEKKVHSMIKKYARSFTPILKKNLIKKYSQLDAKKSMLIALHKF